MTDHRSGAMTDDQRPIRAINLSWLDRPALPVLRTLEATGNVNSSKDWSLGDFVRLVLPLGNAPKACPAAFGFGSSSSDNHAPTSPTLILKKTWGLEQKGIQYGNLNSVNPTTPSIHRPYTFPSLERSFGPSVRTRRMPETTAFLPGVFLH